MSSLIALVAVTLPILIIGLLVYFVYLVDGAERDRPQRYLRVLPFAIPLSPRPIEF